LTEAGAEASGEARGELELTPRAVATGMGLGALLCVTNVYVVLKTGWSLGVALTSSIVAYGLFRVFGAAGLAKRAFGPRENGIVVSVASAAAFMTGGGNMAALPALLVLTGARPSGPAMIAWFGAIAALGVVAAIPLKRQLIDVEKLPFPSSVATAETIRSMHGGAAGARRAKLLGGAALVAGLVTALRESKAAWLPLHLPGKITLPLLLGGQPLAAWSLALDASPVLIGGGSLMGARTAWSMALGALGTYGLLAPALARRGLVEAVEFKKIVEVTLWPGAAILVAAALVSFALDWRAIGRSLEAALAIARGRRATAGDPREAPLGWFFAGVAILGPVTVALMRALFGVPVWAGVLAIPFALALAVVAARVTGETDITPTKAIGPVTQLAYGAALPGSVTANVMSGNVTAGVGLHAADLLSDVKTGWVLGVTPRKQVLAQLFGVAIGALVVAPAFALLVPSADVLGTPDLPAPAVMVWASVSKVMAGGADGLSPVARALGLAGLAVGAALALLERWLPKHRAFVPSAAGLGMAMVMPASTALTMALGAVIGAIVRARRPAAVEPTLTPLASGAIAGESLVGVAFVLARTLAHR
jgi:uncharacterized oligopeptide transporter (OPT) family protein